MTGCLGTGDSGDGGDDGLFRSDSSGTGDGNAGGRQLGAVEQISFAFDRSSYREEADGATTSTETTGYVTADGDVYEKQVSHTYGQEATHEYYQVGETAYHVTMGECRETSSRPFDADPFGGHDTQADPDDTITLGGREGYVFTADRDDGPPLPVDGGESRPEENWSLQTYVDAETGYLLGSDTEYLGDYESTTSTRFHSLGESFSVEPPARC